MTSVASSTSAARVAQRSANSIAAPAAFSGPRTACLRTGQMPDTVGTEISLVSYMTKRWTVTGIPVVYMWCAHTMNERIAIDAVAYTIEL